MIRKLVSIAVLGSLVAMTGPSLAATYNTSVVDAQITFSFAGASFTDSGLEAEFDFDYELDAYPDHYFSPAGIFNQGDGVSDFGGSADFGGESYSYPDELPELMNFFPLEDDVTIDLSTFGQSSAPDSNGSAWIESVLTFYFYNYSYDPATDETASLTFVFDYDYTFSMSLIEDSPAGGQGNGFFDVSALMYEYDFDLLSDYGLLETEYFGGPAELVDFTGGGQIAFETQPGETFIEISLIAGANSTTLTDAIPEPAGAVLILVGVMGGCLTRRAR